MKPPRSFVFKCMLFTTCLLAGLIATLISISPPDMTHPVILAQLSLTAVCIIATIYLLTQEPR